MSEKSYPIITINVSLAAAAGRVSFSYEGADELSRAHVKANGDIDCAEPKDLGRGPVNLQFQLSTTRVTVDGTEYDLEFVGKQSMSVREHKANRAWVPYLMRCLFRALYLQAGQFGGFGNPGANPHKLRCTNQNNDGRTYKYTLRAKGHAAGGGAVLWLDDDPIIQNSGDGTLLK